MPERLVRTLLCVSLVTAGIESDALIACTRTPTSTASSCTRARRSSATSSSATSPASCGDDEFRAAAPAERLVHPAPRADAAHRRALRRAVEPPAARSWPHRARVRPAPPARRLRPLHHAPEPAVQLDPAGAGGRRDGPAGRASTCTASRPAATASATSPATRCAGIAPDEIVDPRPYCEILRQWSTLHPEFAFLPRKFKIAVTGAREDRAAIAWHDIGLQLLKNEAGEVGFKVLVGGGMGRTPVIGTRGARVPAVAADPGLHRGDRARLQPLRPARQHLQGAHQDPGQGRGPEVHRRGATPSSRSILERDVGGTRAPDSAGRARPRGRALRAARPACAPTPTAIDARRAGATRRWPTQRWLERNVHAAPHRRLPRRDAVAQARRPGARRRHRRPDGRRRRPGRPLQPRRAARHARPEPAAALGARERPARAVAGRPQGRASPRPTSAC